MQRQTHQSDPRILGRRTLERDHRKLAHLLGPGQSVLDAGCGTGAITAGIARAVGPGGKVIGVDRDEGLLDIARREYGDVPNLTFQRADATRLEFEREFDIVSAARVLQWIGDPSAALVCMKRAARPSGLVIVLDYNHIANQWEPDPPEAFREFYRAFLTWRDANGWDNHMADHLPGLFESAGLTDIENSTEDEVAERGTAQFDEQSMLWAEVMENLGPDVSRAGFFDESRLRLAIDTYRTWAQEILRRQTLCLRAVVGRAG